MDTARTPKRKRRRLESSAARRGDKKASSSTRTPGSGGSESKIVWKDSPADKQIKVSGTGKMAVRREMQGFVGRLARASQQSPPSSSEEEKNASRERVRTRRKAVGTPQYEEEKAASRHLMFSPPDRGDTGQRTPNTIRRRRSTERGDSQDELFSVLDQMEQKYASPDVALPLTGSRASSPRKRQQYQQQPPAVAASAASTDEMNLTPTPAPSYSSTGTLSPRSLRTQDVGKTQERTRNQEATKALEAIKEQEALKTPDKPPVVETDPFDDLTDESWALLDQLQSQRAPVGASQAQSQSQTEFVSSQNLALTPRPMPSAVYGEMKKPPPVPPPNNPASVVRPFHAAGAAQQLESPESYKRFLVLEVDRDVVNRSLLLRLLDNQDVQLEALLSDDWYDVLVEAGDTVNIVFTEQDRDGFFSQDVHKTPVNRQLSRILVDNAHNVVVVHPDILVSPTRVTTSFGCLRRAVLQETLAVSRPTNKAAFLGTLKHDLFEHALLNGLHNCKGLLEEAKRIVNSNILGLVECALNEEGALSELEKVIQGYQTWISGAMVGHGTPLNEVPPKNGSKVRVGRVLATEEMMWSIKWGLKGATDASVEGTIADQGNGLAGSGVLPVELKTGSKKYAGVEHQGQVILYTLLLNERYRQQCQEGLLIYVPPIETNRITAMATHVRGLIMARNNFASAIAKVKSIGGSTSTQVFPPMIRNRRDCERCFQVDECVLHHAAMENGTEESSGLDELFTLKTKHLGEADLNYFNQWNRLIDLEQQHAEKNLRALWLQVGWKREQAQGSSTCLAHLKLVSDMPALSESGAKRTLRFVRDRRKRKDANLDGESGVNSQPTSFAGVRFRVDERVILSAESLDGKSLLVHVSRATVRKIEHGLITIESRQCIPSIVKSGQSAVGKDYTWRLDKDAIMSGLRRAKENLVQLFIGTPPEVVSAGTALSTRPELQVRMASVVSLGSSAGGDDKVSGPGDTRRRNLIVHLARPHFKPCRVTDFITRRCRDCAKDDRDGSVAAHGQSLMDAFFELNIDQQRAVQRVLSSLDYALVLGMPGTGKTATIAFTVRVLLFLGFSVLVTSYTHSAVDNLLLKLFAYKIPMLRIGNTAQVHPMIADFTLDRQAEREGISSVRAMEAKMVDAQLVGCTCLSVNSHVLFAKRRFDFCIVDEATQITQPIVLGALRCADTFVLVGDHYQLPPLVANAQARKEGMDVSLFRRLAEGHSEATQQLSYQYRMNRDIMLLANRLVYGDKLKCGSIKVASNHLKLRWQRQDTIGQKFVWPMRVLMNNNGVMFLDTDAMGEATTESSSTALLGGSGRRRMENVVEAQLIAGLVELLVLGSVPPEEIAVISPFRSQVALLQQHLTAVAAFRRAGGSEWVHSIEVSTIDKYQGKDKGVILVSFVRCNEEKHVGELLTDWRRINVALTRAKQKLLLVGSESTLSGGSALFHVLSAVIQEQQWGYKLPRDAVETLRQFAVSVAAPIEPDPEQGTTPGSRSSQTNNNVKVSLLQRSAGSSSGDIESLVPNVSSVPLRQRQGARLPQMKPISRDIFGEM
ncbi:Tripartite DNA replication factor [Phytophthora pseudosyringae]|uniref:DNA replication ATP-dependent helicase/nuclease n=1 Tax=Phytophthora pseudosyringae TaxID=221518 RepID=A0A8T1VQW2_9STRA|nr:Tripartite DNA replication factor [Phytophthora pseudosyringae]